VTEEEEAEPSRGNDESSDFVSFEGYRSTEDLFDDRHDESERLARSCYGLRQERRKNESMLSSGRRGRGEGVTSTTTSRFPMKRGMTLAWTGVI
jgi:hypothetical protein